MLGDEQDAQRVVDLTATETRALLEFAGVREVEITDEELAEIAAVLDLSTPAEAIDFVSWLNELRVVDMPERRTALDVAGSTVSADGTIREV
jgi:hypothetical protein